MKGVANQVSEIAEDHTASHLLPTAVINKALYAMRTDSF